MMNDQDIILKVKNLNVRFRVGDDKIHIVKDVSFDVKRGQTVAVVGESGCGKSVTMGAILRLLDRKAEIQADEISFYEQKNDHAKKIYRIDQIKRSNGKEMNSLRGQRISMVFQDPMTSLDPVHRVGDQVMEVLRQHYKVSKKEAKKKIIELFRKLGISDPEKRFQCYPHELSGGMKQRIVIAIAIICNPDLIICDEPTTALDVTIQAQIIRLLMDLQKKLKNSIILITHNMGIVAEMATDVCVMYMGRIVEMGSKEEVFDNPRHPYTIALLKSVPVLDMEKEAELYSIPGVTPDPKSLIIGCEFADRCEYCCDECRKENIELRESGAKHFVRCIRDVSQLSNRGVC